ncbi:hypothetical protein ANANG_G00200970 [Anguilla anguilla]|uniref:Uncharacterized protein n=1 Tax=Anguilla anguilla TaxID=7936 RepID=A0A9D3M5G3_ANGAN|nr:hypothetical protein ANANG_G00200970 [Anguilla anguilla]
MSHPQGAQASPSDGAIVSAKVGGVSMSAGPAKVQVDLGNNTGVSAGPDGVDLQLLGTDIKTRNYHSRRSICRCGHLCRKGFTHKSFPKVEAYAGTRVGHLKADLVGVETVLDGPNASVGAQASLSGEVSAIFKAGVGSVSVASGPMKVTAGLGVDTGVSVGPDGVEVQLLGTGIRLGPNPKVSVLGSSVECSVM